MKMNRCPFCGEKEEVWDQRFDRGEHYKIDGVEWWRCECLMCDGSGPWQGSSREAIEAWNKRA